MAVLVFRPDNHWRARLPRPALRELLPAAKQENVAVHYVENSQELRLWKNYEGEDSLWELAGRGMASANA